MDSTSSSPPAGRLVIGARGSMLAVAQAELIAAGLRANHPALQVAVRTFTTRGDRGRAMERPVAEVAIVDESPVAPPAVGGKGLFTAELEAALADGTIDLAVHSAKDLPGAMAAGTEVLAWPAREDARDALIIGTDPLTPGTLASIAVGATVGTSSLRRAGQLKWLRPDLNVQPIRGNIETRIGKVRQGRFAATLLAAAGLRRAGLLGEAAQIIPVEQITPAAGQGALALQGRQADRRVRLIASILDDRATRRAVEAERLVVARLAGGCAMPLGVYVEELIGPGSLPPGRLRGLAVLVGPTGRPRIQASAQADSPADVAALLVEQLLAGGGADLLNVRP